MNKKVDIPTILKLARAKLGWSQQDLAKKSGIKQSQLSRYESGKSAPRHDVAKKLADALGIDIEKIYTKEVDQIDLMYSDTESVTIDIPAELYKKLSDSARKTMSPLDVEIRRRLTESFESEFNQYNKEIGEQIASEAFDLVDFSGEALNIAKNAVEKLIQLKEEKDQLEKALNKVKKG